MERFGKVAVMRAKRNEIPAFAVAARTETSRLFRGHSELSTENNGFVSLKPQRRLTTRKGRNGQHERYGA